MSNSNSNKKYILCYGTLRKQGDKKKTYNFNRFGGQTYIKTLQIDGYEMYNLGFFPCIVKGNGKITVELHEVENGPARSIDLMESGAGYNKDNLNVKTEEIGEVSAGIYYWDKDKVSERIIKNNLIQNGDWCA